MDRREFTLEETEENLPPPNAFGDADEERLLAACQAGHRDGWQEFIDRYTNLIYYVIRQRCGYTNEDDAKEIYQSVFVKILKSIRNVREKTKLRSWLLAVTWNECIDFSRKRKVQHRFFVPEESSTVHPSYDQEYYVGLRELLGMFQAAFTRMTPQNRELLSQKYKGATVEEISAAMDIPKGSIYYNHKKACKELSQVLRDMRLNYDDLQEAFPQFLLPLDARKR